MSWMAGIVACLAFCSAAHVIAVVITNKVIVSWTCGARTVRFIPGQYPPAPLSGLILELDAKKLVRFSLALLTYL